MTVFGTSVFCGFVTRNYDSLTGQACDGELETGDKMGYKFVSFYLRGGSSLPKVFTQS